MRLKGKTALVTGGSRGIGRATVLRLARDGARIVFTYKENKAAAEELLGLVPGAVAVRADQEDLAGIDAIFEPSGMGSTSWSTTPPSTRQCRSPS
jgi:3-oxoacyl-[acyl-carrier protein] reductase